MLHEYCHVLLQWEPGSLTTLKYVREWLRHGYWNNRFEIEARDFARRHEGRLRQMLRDAAFETEHARTLESGAGVAPRINLGAETPEPTHNPRR